MTDPLVQYLRDAACGRTEWRVQHPVTRDYCVAFDGWHGGERAARQWLADEISKHPDGMFAGYEVAEVVWYDDSDRLMRNAAIRIETLIKEKQEQRSALINEIQGYKKALASAEKQIEQLLLAGCQKDNPDTIKRLTEHRSILRDSAKDVIAWSDANQPAGDAYCIARLRHAIAATEDGQ